MFKKLGITCKSRHEKHLNKLCFADERTVSSDGSEKVLGIIRNAKYCLKLSKTIMNNWELNT